MKRFILFIVFFVQLLNPGRATQQLQKESGQLLADWIQIHLQLVRTTKGVPHVAYSRHFAYTAIAVYEAAISGQGSYRSLEGQLPDLSSLPEYKGEERFSASASANAAYAEMLRTYYGNNANAGLIDSFEQHTYRVLRKSECSEQEIIRSSEYGKSMARAILKWSSTDESEKVQAQFVASGGEGTWQPTPPKFTPAAVPFWMHNRMMSPVEAAKLIPAAPPQFSAQKESEFYSMVKDLYDITQRLTPEQHSTALFWDDSPNGKFVTVPGHWSSILAQVISDKEIPLLKSAEAFVRMHMALYDACIIAWYGKYTYMVVRPVTYIQKYIDSAWQPLIETPNHPEFPAAHATLSSAAAMALTAVLGNVAFTDKTYSDLGMQPHVFVSFEEAAREAGMSRLYGGIHYLPSIEQGLIIGKRTAENTLMQIRLIK